jgi:hypothetical protein
MTPRTAAFAVIALADCRTIRFTFHPPQNDSVSTTGVATKGSSCTHGFRSFASLQMTSGAIVKRPGNGTLSEIGALQFRYTPKAWFRGTDQYAGRICGRGASGSGCSTLTYNITVE